MDGAFLLLVLGIFCCGFLLVVFCCGSWGGAQSALDWVMGTLGMLGSNFSWKLILMGICLIDGVAGLVFS
jgi:hypothetical protein